MLENQQMTQRTYSKLKEVSISNLIRPIANTDTDVDFFNWRDFSINNTVDTVH